MKPGPHTKSAFADQFDFEGLKYASTVRVILTDGQEYEVRVHEYWPTGEAVADLLIGHIGDGPEKGRPVHFHVPSPELERIDIVRSFDHENHPSHPEVGYSFSYISDLYQDEVETKKKP